MQMRKWVWLAVAMMWSGAANAERWVKVDPKDPYSSDGQFHWFDVDSAYEDSATGLVFGWGTYKKAADIDAGPVRDRFLWAFDCERKQVHYVASEKAGARTETAGWREKSTDLGEPVMGGVTNLFGQKLCALKGSWPRKALSAELPAATTR
jgi:hypothetical protein